MVDSSKETNPRPTNGIKANVNNQGLITKRESKEAWKQEVD